MEKIKRNNNFQFSTRQTDGQVFNFKVILWLLIFLTLFYTRFINISWGLPYPFHPDERNMAVALANLKCEISNFEFRISNFRKCANPHFFAYGQFPLYLGYLLILIYKLFSGKPIQIISFEEAVISLRLISALASAVNAFVLIKILKLVLGDRYSIFDIRYWENRNKDKSKSSIPYPITFLIIIFSPFFIQFAHFGTTESLLMLFYSLIIFICLKLIDIPKVYHDRDKFWVYIFFLAFIEGLAVGTKVSSLIFVFIPLFVIFYTGTIFARSLSKWYQEIIFNFGVFLFSFLFFSIIFSPHNLISWQEFISSLRYESDVALGKYVAFYTRQFITTVPILFQLVKIFPYALGWPVYVLSFFGFLGLSWKDKKINLLRLAFLVYFIPNAFLFAKWTRFMAPILPLMLVFAILFLFNFKERIFSKAWKISNIKYQKSKIDIKNQKFYILISHFAFYILIFTLIAPGIAYLSIYQNSDVRFTASQWIYKNIPENAYILSETANVVDLPLPVENGEIGKFYRVVSFNFYDLDENTNLQEELKYHLKKADYIIVPSRRIFANHVCIIKNQKSKIKTTYQISKIFKDKNCQLLEQKYPLVNSYYKLLFSEQLGFKKIAEFSSYPKIEFKILNFKFKINFPDEEAEETWSVFDHPVIRIYKKTKS